MLKRFANLALINCNRRYGGLFANNGVLAHKVRKNSEGSGPMGEKTIVEL
jgi:hypothetical protein